MLNYVIRRLLYAVPIVLGVNILTALLFFYVNSPDEMARTILGEKNITPEAIESWKRDHGYNNPLLVNTEEEGLSTLTQTIFFQKSAPLLWFDFGRSDRKNENIGSEMRKRMWPSLAIALPTFFIGILVNLTFAMIVAFFRGTYVDLWGVILCVLMMSISSLFYIIGGQFVFGKIFKLFPISGYDTGVHAWKFVILPVVIGVIGGAGGGIRFFRTVFLEEIGKDYIRTARAKGLPEVSVLFKHGLKNAMIPILTDISYTLVDPRIRLE